MQGRGWVTSGGSGSGGAFVGSGPQGAALGDARGRGGAGEQAGGISASWEGCAGGEGGVGPEGGVGEGGGAPGTSSGAQQ